MEKLSNEKRLEILKAAVDLFSERGFERTTVDEIAADANVGKGTIYLYFENKEKIFIAILEKGIQEILRQMEEALNEPGDFRRQLQDMLRKHLQFIEAHREFYKIFLKEHFNLKFIGDKDSQARLTELHQKLHRQLTQFIQTGIDQGQIRHGDPNLFAFAFSGIISHCSFHWLMGGENTSLVEQTAVILDLFFNGVGKKS